MNTVKNFLFKFGLVFFLLLASCGNDDDGATPNDPNIDNVDPDNPNPDNPDPNNPQPTGESRTYTLGSVAIPNISGTAKFVELDDGSTDIEIELLNTEAGEMHPGHIHLNTAVEGGEISISLNAVDGTTGMGNTNVTALDDGTAISYETLLDFDGYINIHLNETDLTTLIAQGDIGQNELTGVSKIYPIDSSITAITGTVTFAERINGEILACIELQNKGPRPVAADIFLNSVIEGGENVISLTRVDSSGTSKTNIARFDDGSVIDYTSLLVFDGHIAVSNSEFTSDTFIAEGDIGQNELTGTSKVYELPSVDIPAISGTATFAERISGETLITVALQNTMATREYEGAIYVNSAIEDSPEKAISLSLVEGGEGIGQTHVSAQDNGAAISYDDLINFDGHIEYIISDLGSFVIARGDIGQNELTGEFKTYFLEEGNVTDPEASTTFFERASGEALAVIEMNTTFDGVYPSHIHMNDFATGGPSVFSFNPDFSAGGISKIHVAELDDGTAFGYADVLTYDGYIDIHADETKLNLLLAHGNIGSNEN